MSNHISIVAALACVSLAVACSAKGTTDTGFNDLTGAGDDGGASSSGSSGSSGSSSSGGRDSGRSGSSSGGSSSGGSTSSSSGGGSSSGSSGTSGGTDSGAPPPSDCSTTTTQADCGECCYQQHMAGAAAGEQAFGDCVCATPGTCATQCAASYCSANGPQPTPGDACDTCLQGANACEQAAETACKANADCAALEQCQVTANCGTKP